MDQATTTRAEWVTGDMLGLQIPAHSGALREGGTAFLTQAFRAVGALAADNSVARITQFEECRGGSTGRKLLLSVAYEKPAPELHTELFVKFSRDFDDEVRDRAKNQLEAEVRFGLLSRTPGFPIAVPACYFADYHHESGTGILITQRIAFGTNGIELPHEKCMDYEMPEPLQHYRAIFKALGRLAGTHKAGRLSESVAERFPFDAHKEITSDKIPYTQQQLLSRISRYAEFAAKYPQLLPANITAPAFIAKMTEEAPRFLEHELTIKQYLYSKPEFIALIHWNANVDNAWFWRNPQGELECGLMDWGRVSQMNVALALWGGFSAAEREMWDNNLDELLTLFAAEFHRCGGPVLDVQELKFHMQMFIAMLGIAWLLSVPTRITAHLPNLAEIESRFDPRFKASEAARTQLHMMINFLNQWQTQDFGKMLDRLLLQQAG